MITNCKRYTNLHLLSTTPTYVEYCALHTISKREVQLKIQNNPNSTQLQSETYQFTQLQDIQGIPEVIDYGNNSDNRFFLAIQPLGPSLYEFQKSTQFTLKSVLLIGVQLIEIVSHIHQKNLIINNINPYTLCLGVEQDNKQLYLKDLSQMNVNGTYPTNFSINDRNWKFISHQISGKTIPTFKDDLLCIGNVLFYLLNGTLPWWYTEKITNEKQLQEIQNQKLNFIKDIQLPIFLREYYSYLLNVKPSQQPNYIYLKNILISKIYENGWKLNDSFDIKQEQLILSQCSLASCKSRTRGTSIQKSPWLEQLSPIQEVDKELEFAFSLSGKKNQQQQDQSSLIQQFDQLRESIKDDGIEYNLSFNSCAQNECEMWKKLEILNNQSKPMKKMINQ